MNEKLTGVKVGDVVWCSLSSRRWRWWLSTCLVGALTACAPMISRHAGLLRHAVAQDPPASSPAALDAYSSAANLQNNGAFDLAAEEWEAFLKKHAADPLAAKARHYLAVCRIQLKQFDKAETLLVEVTKDTKFPLLEEALLHLGYSRFTLGKGGDQEKLRLAAAAFATQIKRFPQGKLADQGLFFQGEAWFELGDMTRAEAVYRAMLKHFPKSPLRCDAWYALGTALESQQKWPEATDAYESYLAGCPDAPDVVAVRLRKAETLVPQKKYDDAYKLFDELSQIEGFEDADAAAMGAASCLFLQGKFAESGRRYLDVAQKFPRSTRVTDALLAAGKAYYRAKQYDAAAGPLQDLVSREHPSRWEAAHWLARIHLARREPGEASKLLASLPAPAADHPWSVALQLDQADALFDSGELDQAYVAYVKVADGHSQHKSAPQSRYNAAVTALQLGRAKEARAQAEAYLSAYPQGELRADARFVLAESLLSAGEADAAASQYEALVKEFPQHPNAVRFELRRAAAWYVQKQYDQVINELPKLLSRITQASDKAQAHFLIGVSHFGKREFGPAAEQLRASVLADAKWSQADEALLFLARAQASSGQADAAIASLQSMINGYPNSSLLPQAYYRLGELHYGQGKLEAAAAAYDESLKRDGAGELAPFARSGKGWTLLKRRDYAGAEKVFSSLIESAGATQPGREALLARAMCRRQMKQFEGALSDLDAFLKLDAGDSLQADALYEKGLTLIGMKQPVPAVKALRALLERFPEYRRRDRVWFELAWAVKAEDGRQAVAAFEQLVKDHPQSELAAEAWFQIGETRYGDKDYPAAEGAYRKAQSLAKTAEVGELATYKLGWALYHQKKYAPAAEQFARQTSTYQQGTLRADGLFMLGECRFKTKQYGEAWKSFGLAKAFPPRTAQIGALLLLHGAQSAAQEGQWEAARKWLDEFLTQHADSPLAPEAQYELGRAAHQLGDLPAARRAWEQATSTSKSVIAVQAQFMLGELAFEQKQFDEAVKQFRRTMLRFGAERAPAEFHPWQARAAFEAARCHEVRIRDAKSAAERLRHMEEANRFYRHVVEKYPQNELAETARKRLAALAQLN